MAEAVLPGGPSALPLGRTLGTLYACGGALALLWTALPHEHATGDAVVVAMATLAVCLGGLLRLWGHRAPTWSLHTALAAIQVVIGVAYAAEGGPSSDLRLFFLWATPYAVLCFGTRAAVAHLSWTGAVFVAALTAMPRATHVDAVATSIMLLGTLTATATLVATAAAGMRSAEAAQRHDATHDALTGLGNRRLLVDTLQATGHGAGALVLLDLDGFKAVNDRHGHGVGDELLRGVADGLRGSLRPGDLVCRLGGDEFAVVLRGPLDEVEAVAAARPVAAASSVRLVVAAGSPPVAVGASAGVRLLSDDDLAPSAALRDADAALYTSKHQGRGVPSLWSPGMRPAGAEQLELAEDLREALRCGQLHLAYQPVVEVATLRVLGVEVLARWSHPVRGTVPPDRFVPCAERAGLARDLTRWVLSTAFREAAAWPTAEDGTRTNVAVNVSAVQLADLAVVDDVRVALAESGLSPSDVVLEVTETAAVVDLTVARTTLEALARLGVGLALDDFGTGFSSLTHVQALPFDILKVDRSFVSAAATGDRRAVATIAAVGALAAQLGVDVVAEGVEDLAELPSLQALGCGYAQGYAIARPMTAAEVVTRLHRQVTAGV